MASGFEMMAANLLKSFGFDPEVLKKEFDTRVTQFEDGLKLLNSQLYLINKRLENIETHMGIEKTPEPIELKTDGKPPSVN